MAKYQVGDKVRLMRVPPYLFTDDPLDQGTAEFIGRCVGKIFRVEDFDEHGQFSYRYLDHYWTEAGRYAYFVRADGRLAGFVLVRTLEEGDSMACSRAEFFILRKYRRLGVEGQAAQRVFGLFAGAWRVHQEAQNLSALAPRWGRWRAGRDEEGAASGAPTREETFPARRAFPFY